MCYHRAIAALEVLPTACFGSVIDVSKRYICRLCAL